MVVLLKHCLGENAPAQSLCSVLRNFKTQSEATIWFIRRQQVASACLCGAADFTTIIQSSSSYAELFQPRARQVSLVCGLGDFHSSVSKLQVPWLKLVKYNTSDKACI